MTDEEKKYERDRWKEMTLSQKAQHFCTYYLAQTAAAAAILIFAVWFIHHVMSPREITALGVYVFDDYFDEEASEAFNLRLREDLGLTEKREIVVLAGGYSDSQYHQIMTIQARQAVNEVDLIIGTEETFRHLAGLGYMVELDEALDRDFLDSLSDRIVEAAGPDLSEGYVEPDIESPEGKGEVGRYGISLKGSKIWEDLMLSGSSDCIAAVAEGSENGANIEVFLRDLFSD